MIGSLMEQIIEIGKRKGYVTTDDVNQFYPAPIRPNHNLVISRMNTLVYYGYFKKPEHHPSGLKWEYAKCS